MYKSKYFSDLKVEKTFLNIKERKKLRKSDITLKQYLEANDKLVENIKLYDKYVSPICRVLLHIFHCPQ